LKHHNIPRRTPTAPKQYSGSVWILGSRVMLSIGTIQSARCYSFARYSANIFAQIFGQICACTEMFLIRIIQTTFINLFGRKIPGT
jgi:hypothetical protein